MNNTSRFRPFLIAALLIVGSIYTYAQLASAMDNYYYKDIGDSGAYVQLYMSYQSDTNSYTAKYTEFSSEGHPTGSSEYSGLSEFSTGNLLEDIFDPESPWYEEA